ncbi:Fe-S cluster assembly protein SufD [Glaciihabitans arcticus]|uniref:Fe-S cluster assembly protein SufD n=1 Tax=Glaciihabitans arcticus TaxID=2668039 RepID=A0A4Q9GRH7_9MICO|nr:Fe-S cluster assembly protein SufD [Glaciihabitans arcticus]TBN56684.1 Fe-S cluster assembly protein SufD [Glaciihabitans arcticus]
MTVATPETEVQHGAKAHSDGGWGNADRVVPVQTRSKRFASNKHSEYPAVTGRELEWKHSPVDLIRPLIDGELDGSPYEYLSMESAGVRAEWVAPDDARVGSAATAEEKSSANAWGSVENVLAVTVTANTDRGDEPAELTITRSAFGPTARAAHTVITAEPGSTGLVILQNTGKALLSENIEIVVGDNANLTVVSVQEWADDAIHLATHVATVGRAAVFRHIIVSTGGKVVRINPTMHLNGEGADGELYGVYFADAGQHLEQRVYMHHSGANTRGRVNYKGALQGEGAHTVWIGDVLIGQQAAGTDSYEQNRNLVLSEGTRADSIPNLEIETGDIAGAGHASATGRFDDEQLFYLQARGITEDEARRLVVLGFLSEIIQKIGKPDLEARLQKSIETELSLTSVGPSSAGVSA